MLECLILFSLHLESTNAGKTLPPCLFPFIVQELNRSITLLVKNPKCIFLTALNSIKESLANKMNFLGLKSTVLTSENCKDASKSEEIKILFVSPEVLQQKIVIQALLSIRDSVVIKCVDEAHLFMAWGVEKKNGKTFRPAMQLSSGELASLKGITLLQTATASSKTIRMFEDEFPEITAWKKILNIPFRSNISIIIPPASILPSKYQKLLLPFVNRILDFGEPHLFIVRSINSGTEVYFNLVNMLGQFTGQRSVAFYHSNTSENRKNDILRDLSLPLNSPDKRLNAVVATASLGVGVDIRVKNVVCFGLGSTPENLVQEAGRCQRGKQVTDIGLAFFFQKGSVAALHCPPSSDCRELLANPLPRCQTTRLFRHFDPEFDVTVEKCICCYSCKVRDAEAGCERCAKFLDTYIPKKTMKSRSVSFRKGLKRAVKDLCEGLGIHEIAVETRLFMGIESFASDFVRAFDEINRPEDIVSLWHISAQFAQDLYDVSKEYLEFQCTESIIEGDTVVPNGEPQASDESETDTDTETESSDIETESASETESDASCIENDNDDDNI